MAEMGWATRCLRPTPTTLWSGSFQAGSMCSTPRSCSSAAAATVLQSRSLSPLLSARNTATVVITRLCWNSVGRWSRITVSLQAMAEGNGRERRGASNRAPDPRASANMAGRVSCSMSVWPRASRAGTSTGFSMDRWRSMGSRSLCCTRRSYRRLSMRAPFSTSLMPLSV